MIQPIKPKEGTWKEVGLHRHDGGVIYENALGIIAISSVHIIDGKPNLHVSFSQAGERIGHGFMEALLNQWGICDWEEDNHAPHGKVRNYWKILFDDRECECKASEVPIEEPGGYIWRK